MKRAKMSDREMYLKMRQDPVIKYYLFFPLLNIALFPFLFKVKRLIK